MSTPEQKRELNRLRQARWLDRNREQKYAEIAARDKRNPELRTRRNKRWKQSAAGKASTRRTWLRRTHGLTVEQYDTLFAAQGSRCATCGTTDPGVKARPWHLDHDHHTGMLRGFLCQRCNMALGHVQDKISTLLTMVRYLKNPPAKKFNLLTKP